MHSSTRARVLMVDPGGFATWCTSPTWVSCTTVAVHLWHVVPGSRQRLHYPSCATARSSAPWTSLLFSRSRFLRHESQHYGLSASLLLTRSQTCPNRPT